MKLSEILRVRERIQELIDYNHHEHWFDAYAGHISNMFDTETIIQQPFQTLISGDISIVRQEIKAIKTRLQEAITLLDQQRKEIEGTYYEESEQVYNDNVHAIGIAGDDAGEKIVYRNQPNATSEEIRLIADRIGLLNDWRLPGIILRPGKDTFIDKLVALDPLYIVDMHPSLLAPAVARYNPQYQRRIRQYVIGDHSDKIFGELPQQQFGFCFAYNFFSVKTVSIITKYIKEIYDLLRPGGVVAFTFSNGDKWRSVFLAESGFHCYTPESQLQHAWESLNYELRFRYDSDAEWTYIELKKPGEIETMRGGQSLAQIIPIES